MELPYSQEQHSPDWYRARLGCITGSKVGVLMKGGRGKDEIFSVTAKSYLYQVAGERALSHGIVDDDDMLQYYLDQTNVQSKAMRFGTEQEANARALYAELTGREVHEVGLCVHPLISYYASSPDGIIADGGVRGCLEIKCPSVSTFTQYATEIVDNPSLLRVNPDYFYQCQAHMDCTDSDFCDFVAYCPFMANPMHIVRISRDPEAILQMRERVQKAEEVVVRYQQLLLTA